MPVQHEQILQGKLAIEFKTVSKMVEIYCFAHHGTEKAVCASCAELLNYAQKRLDRCPYGQENLLVIAVQYIATSESPKSK